MAMTASFFKFRPCAAFLTACRLLVSYPSTDEIASTTTCKVLTVVRTPLTQNRPSTLPEQGKYRTGNIEYFISPFQTTCHRFLNGQHRQFLVECRDALGMPSKLPLRPCSALHPLQTAEASACKCLEFEGA
uniref:Secreted protein n=1 Tax=Oryza glumipatula TaxID=40148 RepID=A0A0E0BC35_9ORYZ